MNCVQTYKTFRIITDTQKSVGEMSANIIVIVYLIMHLYTILGK